MKQFYGDRLTRQDVDAKKAIKKTPTRRFGAV